MRSSKLANKAAQYRWIKSNVNLRKGGNSTSRGSLGIVPGGEKVRYLKASKGWSQVVASKGTGWIKNSYLTAKEIKQYPVAVYGTLRKGQKAYYMVKGRTTSEVKTKIVSHDLFLRRDLTWLRPHGSRQEPGKPCGRRADDVEARVLRFNHCGTGPL